MTDAQLEDKVKQEQTDKFVCKSCGANMVFSPEKIECFIRQKISG